LAVVNFVGTNVGMSETGIKKIPTRRPLFDKTVQNLKPAKRPYKRSDGGGLYVLVTPDGSRYWRMAYRFNGKQRTLALGVYPTISLAEAREARDAAKKLLVSGVDPLQAKREQKRQAKLSAENTFEAIAREWHEKQKDGWTPKYAASVLKRFEADIFPEIGSRPIALVEAPELLDALRKVETRDALDVAKRLRETAGQVFRYAIQTGRAMWDPSADLKGALRAAGRQQHHKAMPREELPHFLRALACYDGSEQTKFALRLVLLTFVRTTELRAAKWAEFNFDAAEWRLPAERMKMRDAHIVPLSRQAIEVLTELRGKAGNSEFVFPSPGAEGCMSNNTMLFAMYRMGYHGRATVHGFRAVASTILNEMGFNPDWIERQLAHSERNKVRSAYNHAQYLAERCRMMQHWANYLDTIAVDNKVVSIASARVAR
jgi:integrase